MRIELIQTAAMCVRRLEQVKAGRNTDRERTETEQSK